MSTVLEKAVLTDDTGKQIKGTLEEIRDAITGSGSTHYPVRIQVATPPEKVDYIVGETLDLTGIIVNAIFDNGVPYDVTENCTFDPDDGDTLTAQDTAINVTWTWTLGEVVQTFHASRGINVSTVESIEITTPPDTVDYAAGDTLDLTGMVVKANMSNNTQIDVTSQCTYSPDDGDTLTTSDTAITATLSVSGSTFTATQAITVVVPVYGVEWDGSSSPVWTRTDAAVGFADPVPYYNGMTDTPSSPFDNISPWKDIEIVNFTESGNNAGSMVKIPKFYYKRTVNTDTGSIKLQISTKPQTGFSVSPLHRDRGDGVGERDVAYISRYKLSSDSFTSRTGYYPFDSISTSNIATVRQNVRTNAGDSETFLWDMSAVETLRMLYLVEFAHWNVQLKIGLGGHNSTPVNAGQTDQMPYHTGTVASSRLSLGMTQYRHVEGLWNTWNDLIDGFAIYSGTLKLYTGSIENIDTNIAAWSNLGTLDSETSNNCLSKLAPSALNGYEWVLYPINTVYNANYDTYVCDGISVGLTTAQLLGTGAANGNKNGGLFSILSGTTIRSMKLPSA